jgi:hypothetical protein
LMPTKYQHLVYRRCHIMHIWKHILTLQLAKGDEAWVGWKPACKLVRKHVKV